MQQPWILTVTCPDATGIVSAVAGHLAAAGLNIHDSQQFGDTASGRFFMRVVFDPPAKGEPDFGGFTAIAERFGMDWKVHPPGRKPRIAIMVSRFGHCLNDLLYRYRVGDLAVEIPAVISNHRDFYQLAAWHDVPFHHVPVTAGTKDQAEARLREIVAQEEVELIVLARYMQVLSPAMCRDFAGRIINIHHSFLPSFKGARPYHQAFARGVKVIGATAHYVTEDLDEGPIIAQDVAPVDHRMGPEELAALGRDIEARTLARAVHSHIEHRVFLNDSKTVVFG